MRWLAAYKLAVGALLLALGFELIHLFDEELEEVVLEWVLVIHADPHHPWIVALLERVDAVEGRALHELAWVALAFGALHGAEGVGLWLRRRWSEYLCLVSTGALLPMEIHELVSEPTPVHALVLAANVAVLVYLARRTLVRLRETG